jgi:membrane-associated phospholipid phosphatase
MKSKAEASFLGELGRRLKTLVWLKAFGIPGFMAVFFVSYFAILNHALFSVTVMPVTIVDQAISYRAGAWLLYVSLWLYVQLPAALIDLRRELVIYGCSAAAVSLVGFGIFLLWPTAVPAMTEVAVGAPLASLKNLDTTGNSCPSLHVAFSVFTAVWLGRFLCQAGGSAWLRWANVGWCLGIVYSTLATKQHVLLDVFAGAVLGAAGAAMQIRVGKGDRALRATAEADQIRPAARKL